MVNIKKYWLTYGILKKFELQFNQIFLRLSVVS